MRALIKQLFIGTWLESPVKRAHAALTRSKSSLYDWQTIAIMERVLAPDSNAIDIGAFEGGMLRHMLRFAPRGKHTAFEPTPEQYQRLLVRFPGVRVHGCALGAEPGLATFYCMLNHPALSGLSRRARDLQGEHVRDIQVAVDTLDRTVPSDLPIALIKMDVEGGELGVLRGGIQTLRRNRPVIIFECGLGGADYFGVQPQEIFDTIRTDIGLKVSLLGQWLSGGGALSRQEFVDQYEGKLNFYFVAHA